MRANSHQTTSVGATYYLRSSPLRPDMSLADGVNAQSPAKISADRLLGAPAGPWHSVVVAPPLIVRKEYPADIAVIRELLVGAFPTPAEAELVDALRAAGRLSISLVAVEDGAVIGHAGFSPVTVDGRTLGLGLAPVAVRADRRGRGVGERLVRDGLALCRNAAVGLIVVLGEPRYYARFGFEAARRHELRDDYQAGDSFQALELIPGTIRPGGGLVRYADEFARVSAC